MHHSFVIVDIERFGRRADTDQRWLRKQMYDVLCSALDDTGVAWDACDKQDHGDSVILLVPANVSKMLLTDTFVERLDRELSQYARRSSDPVRMRMRLALHAGEVSRDEHGWIGRDLNTACRLVDLQRARDALAQAPDANLVLVVSGFWYSSVVEQDPVLAERLRFERIPFVAKEIDSHAWLHVRRHGGAEAARNPADGTEKSVAAPADAAGGIHFHGPVHRVGDPVQGDKFQITLASDD